MAQEASPVHRFGDLGGCHTRPAGRGTISDQ